MRGKCKALGTIYLIAGIFGTIGMAYQYGYIRYERSWLLTFFIVLIGVAVSFIPTIILYTLDETLSMVWNLKSQLDRIESSSSSNSSGNVSKSYVNTTPANSNSYRFKDEEPKKGYWICPLCGRENPPQIKKCMCRSADKNYLN